MVLFDKVLVRHILPIFLQRGERARNSRMADAKKSFFEQKIKEAAPGVCLLRVIS